MGSEMCIRDRYISVDFALHLFMSVVTLCVRTYKAVQGINVFEFNLELHVIFRLSRADALLTVIDRLSLLDTNRFGTVRVRLCLIYLS